MRTQKRAVSGRAQPFPGPSNHRSHSPESMTDSSSVQTSVKTWSATLPPRPQIFFGRDTEKTAAVQCIMHMPDNSAHIAILGAPGIGKTSLAVSIVHEPTVVAQFRERRVLVQCDTANDSTALWSLIGLSLGIAEPCISKLRSGIKMELSEKPAILVLDNFETPWEAETARANTEELLANLAEIQSLTLFVTMRGTQRPAGVQWARPFLLPLATLDHESSSQVFMALADVTEDDPDVPLLLNVMDGMPLALTLMANMAQYESCSRLVAQWAEMQTAMLQRGNATRLSSVDTSLELSLASSRMQSNPDAIKLLSILALFPDSIDMTDIVTMMPSINTISQCISTLLQSALAYRTSHQRLCALCPIRAYMLKYHKPSQAVFQNVLDHVVLHVQTMNDRHDTIDSKLNQSIIQQESYNYENVLLYAVKHGIMVENAIGCLINLSKVVYRVQSVSLNSLQIVLTKAVEIGSKSLQAQCLRSMATISRLEDMNYDYKAKLKQALQIAYECNDIQEQVLSLLALARPGLSYNTIEVTDYASRAVMLAHQYGMVSEEARGWMRLGQGAIEVGDIYRARKYLDQALELCKKSPNPGICGTLEALAMVTGASGNLVASSTIIEEAIAAAHQFNLQRTLLGLKSSAGYNELLRSNIDIAIGHLESALELQRSLSIQMGECFYYLVTAHLANRDRKEAIRVLQAYKQQTTSLFKHQSMNIHVPAEMIKGMLACCDGHIEYDCGDYGAARVHFEKSLQIYSSLDLYWVAELLFEIGNTWHMQSQQKMARGFYIQSATINRKLNERVCLLFTLSNMADTYLAEGDLSTAYALTLAVLPRITWSDMKRRAADCHFRLARIALIQENATETDTHLWQAEDFYRRGQDSLGVVRCGELREAHGM